MPKRFFPGFVLVFFLCIFPAGGTNTRSVEMQVAVKVPGNQAKTYPLMARQASDGTCRLVPEENIPLIITSVTEGGDTLRRMALRIRAEKDIYFNISGRLRTGMKHEDCLFYMPGFWYRKNLRSPREAPSFHTSDSWTVREDRLSTPLTGIFDTVHRRYISVLRTDRISDDALATHTEGEVILSGKSSVGSTGFVNYNGEAAVAVAYPYHETPRTYIRKLTLAPPVQAFCFLPEGEEVTLTWEMSVGTSDDYSGFVRRMWEYSYDSMAPGLVGTPYSEADMKETISNYFINSYVGDKPLKYNSGVHLETAGCDRNGIAEIGFIGRVLLNAFNALEYGEQQNKPLLVKNGRLTFDSYLENGFTPHGFFREFVNFDDNTETGALSIRRQSEGVYAVLYYLDYERKQKRKHPEWEAKLKQVLDLILKCQYEDGSFPRKFTDNLTVVDKSGGSTPSAVLPLVMGYKYFKDKNYLNAARRAAGYLESEIISKADYFSSTLDANCEDKEASLYAATATYYMALVSKGKERAHYAGLCRTASYFALSWYYTWDVPFAQGQMLGDMDFRSRGWGNVSVENNHIDVFIFDFADVLKWLAKEYNEPRFENFAGVISTSMRQLVPYPGHQCGIAGTGYYPEVVQHTNWDYGKNGKGFYNDIFAPGWTVASLWELFTPGRAEAFLLDK